jgi:hypothetical protein
MIMPKFPDTVMPTIYHIETGAFQTYSIDAREMLTSYPEVYKTEPWTEKEKVEFAKRSKADPVKKETPKWVVKEPISLGGTLQNTTGQILENYLNEPNERIVPLNDAAGTRDKNYVRAAKAIRDKMDRARQARDLEISQHPSNQLTSPTMERIHHVPALP